MWTQLSSIRATGLLVPMVLAGLLGGTIGIFAGGLIGAATCDWSIKEAGCIEPSAYGAIIGASILMPLGVHLANWQRWRLLPFLLSLLAVGGIAAAGLAVLVVDEGQEWVLLAIPVLQLIACVGIARPTARPRP